MLRTQVVWATAVKGRFCRPGSSSSHCSSSSGPENTRVRSDQLAAPMTSGWWGSPMTRGMRPASSARDTMR